jgi:hypothetical protein
VTTIRFDRTRPRFPDVNEGHPVNDWDALVRQLGSTRILGFKVGNGWLHDPMSDSEFGAHLRGAENHGLIALGYWFGAQKVEDYLDAFPPKIGRIPCLDFEFQHFKHQPDHVITPQDADDAHTFVTRIHAEWGRWPFFYGHSTWTRAGEPTGTNVENCPYWGPDYLGELTVPAGVGTPVVHQYAASSKGPEPHFFSGVANFRDDDGILRGPDMNCLLVPFERIRQIAGLDGERVPDQPPDDGGEEMPLDAERDQETFNKMLAVALGLGSPADTLFWERTLVGIGDVARGHDKRDGIPEPYASAFDWATGLKPEREGSRGRGEGDGPRG